MGRYRRVVTFGLLFFLFLMFINVSVLARGHNGDDVHVTNINWSIERDVIIIMYDLNAPTDNKYDISITLLREGVPTFSVAPRAVEGDMGQGYFAGTARTIKWHFRDDIPEGLYGEGYYFQIAVKPVSGGLAWYTVALGVAIVGGVVALLVGK
jgi:hypothetical protein